MTKTDSLLFIVEGEKREQDLLSSLSALFSPKSDPIIIPVSMNIYMLYALLQKDGFYTDIVEVLREQVPAAKEKLQGYSRDSFSGVYLFFDFDKQANNLRNGTEADYSNTLRKMLDRFGDATEDGKLYLSYPMVEAFRDFAPESCAIPSGKCFVKRDDFSDYKNASSVSPYQQISHG